jgi:hypothetical protein
MLGARPDMTAPGCKDRIHQDLVLPLRRAGLRRIEAMTVRVIQGFFVGGRPRMPGPVAHPHPASPRPPAPAFAARPPVMQPRGAGDSFPVDPGQFRLANGGGRLLPEAVHGKMEATLGADFSNVRVHIGPQAERIGAIAFTLGSDIYFAPGRFQPDTAHG